MTLSMMASATLSISTLNLPEQSTITTSRFKRISTSQKPSKCSTSLRTSSFPTSRPTRRSTLGRESLKVFWQQTWFIILPNLTGLRHKLKNIRSLKEKTLPSSLTWPTHLLSSVPNKTWSLTPSMQQTLAQWLDHLRSAKFGLTFCKKNSLFREISRKLMVFHTWKWWTERRSTCQQAKLVLLTSWSFPFSDRSQSSFPQLKSKQKWLRTVWKCGRWPTSSK